MTMYERTFPKHVIMVLKLIIKRERVIMTGIIRLKYVY